MTKPGILIGIECAVQKASQRYALLFQIIQELEKQRIEVLCNILNRYNLHMFSIGQTLKHVRHLDIHPAHKYTLNPMMDNAICVYFCFLQGQRQIEQLVQRVDMDKDIQTLVEENRITASDNKVEFLMADYFVSVQFYSQNLLLHFEEKFVCRPQTRPVTPPFKDIPSHLCTGCLHRPDSKAVL